MSDEITIKMAVGVDLLRKIQSLAQKYGTTEAEVVRDAIANYSYLKGKEDDGFLVALVRDSSGRIERYVTLA